MRKFTAIVTISLFSSLPIVAGEAGITFTGGAAIQSSVTQGYNLGLSPYGMFNKTIGLGGVFCFNQLASGNSDYHEILIAPVIKIPLARGDKIKLLFQPGMGLFIDDESWGEWESSSNTAFELSLRSGFSFYGVLFQLAYNYQFGYAEPGIICPCYGWVNIDLGYNWTIKTPNTPGNK